MEHCQTKCHVACVIYNELRKYSAVSFLFLFLVQSKFGKKSWTGRQVNRIFSVVFIFRNGLIANCNKVKYEPDIKLDRLTGPSFC